MGVGCWVREVGSGMTGDLCFAKEHCRFALRNDRLRLRLRLSLRLRSAI